ncbi:MAG: pyridoxamine 5'-phosphate oxidase family protein [bacterium]
MSELKKKILAKAQGPVLAALATITEDGKPWVRYITPWLDKDLTIWDATFLNSRKVRQIRKNPEVHLTLGVSDATKAESYLQIQGRAEVLTDKTSKKKAWIDMYKVAFSGPDDPNYAVLKITPYRIEYQGMGMVPPEIWEK